MPENFDHIQYNRSEEIANVVSHGIGIVLSVAGLIFLVRKAYIAGDMWHMVGFIIFGLSLILMYTSSTLYHFVQKESVKQRLRKLDHSVIYLLIAGTYTPLLLTSLRGTTGWIMFVIVWLFAVIGIIIKLATQIRTKWISATIYLLMGWLAVFIAQTMIESLSLKSLSLIVAGGLFYTLGVIFYVWKKLSYHHAIWHLFVLGGSICHYFAIYFII